MKITICGSIAFYEEMQKIEKKLKSLGHEVDSPPVEVPGPDNKMISVQEYYQIRKTASEDEKWVWDRKKEAIRNHFNKIEWADIVLIANYTKNNIENYIGANTFLEMGLAFYLKKKVFLLNNIPEISYKEEILGMKPIVINNDLAKIC